EYGLGLLTNDRRPKPAGAAVARIAAAWRGREHRPPVRSTALALDTGSGQSVCAPGGAFFEAWAVLAAKGVRPAVVRAEHAQDPGRLAARGITEVLRVRDVVAGPDRPAPTRPGTA
ncbi:glycosyl hydrolase, partial [Streptomyces katrae]